MNYDYFAERWARRRAGESVPLMRRPKLRAKSKIASRPNPWDYLDMKAPTLRMLKREAKIEKLALKIFPIRTPLEYHTGKSKLLATGTFILAGSSFGLAAVVNYRNDGFNPLVLGLIFLGVFFVGLMFLSSYLYQVFIKVTLDHISMIFEQGIYRQELQAVQNAEENGWDVDEVVTEFRRIASEHSARFYRTRPPKN